MLRDGRSQEAAQRRLEAAGLITPVGPDPAALRLWSHCDLASMVEGCFHVALDPRSIDDDGRRPWLSRLGPTYQLPRPQDDGPMGRRYWLLDGEERAGTATLDLGGLGSRWQGVSALYVLERWRRKGLATRMLRALAAAAVEEGLSGVRLGTHWTWQKSLRFYLDRGFWVMGWKHDIQLVLAPRLPEWRFATSGDRARLDLLRDGRQESFLGATRGGGLLRMDAPVGDGGPQLAPYGVGTLAMLLALRGWPLVTSEDRWAHRWRWSDSGEPEGLAYKIGVFEDIAREHGWEVDTPPIEGLDRWQVWARGQERGSRDQLVVDIETVLRARRVPLTDEQLARLRGIDDPWVLDRGLRSAAVATDFEAWFAAAAGHTRQARALDPAAPPR